MWRMRPCSQVDTVLFIVSAFYLGIIMFAFYFRSTSHGIFGNRNCGGFASSNSARI